jgi:hypothetical protein
LPSKEQFKNKFFSRFMQAKNIPFLRTLDFFFVFSFKSLPVVQLT